MAQTVQSRKYRRTWELYLVMVGGTLLSHHMWLLRARLQGWSKAEVRNSRGPESCLDQLSIYIYRYIWYPPPKRPRFSYIDIQSGRWGSQSEIDGMGLRVGGFRV